MGQTLEKMKVVIEGDSAPLGKEAQKAIDYVRKMKASIQSTLKNVDMTAKNSNEGSTMKQLYNTKEMIRRSIQDARTGVIKNAVKEYVSEAQVAAGTKVYTEDYKKICNDIERAERALGNLEQKQRDMDADGVDKESDEWKKVCEQIDIARQRVDKYNMQKAGMEYGGGHTEYTGGLANQSAIKNTGIVASAAMSSVQQNIREFGTSISETLGRIPLIGRLAKESAYLGKKAFGGMKAVLNTVSVGIKKAGGIFASLIQKFASGVPILNRFVGGVKNNNNAFSGGLKSLLKYGLGIRSLFVLFNKLRTAIKEGFGNLVHYSTPVNESLSTLMSSLTQLKNSLATAFAPILTVVTPILNSLIQTIIGVVNAIGQLMAALTGQSFAVKAKKVNQDYAKSLDGAAGSASGAAKAQDEYKRSIMGFDQINKLDGDNDSSGSGGGGGGADYGSMFEEVPIEGKISEFANRIKQAFEDGNWKELGTILGTKINEIVDGVNWSGVGQKIGYWLNGAIQSAYYFLKAVDFKGLGNHTAELLNSALSEIDGEFIGRTIVRWFTSKWDYLIGLLTGLDWKQIGETVGDAFKGAFDEMQEWIAAINWSQLGHDLWQAIKDFVTGLDLSSIAQSFFQMLGSAFGAAVSFIGSFVGDIWADITGYFSDYLTNDDGTKKCGVDWVLGILEGIWDGIKGIGQWIYDNVFTPFIDGFCEAFDINSPSKVMEEQGGFIIEGILEGLKGKIDDVIQWFKDLPDKIKKALGNAKEWLKEKGEDAIEGIKKGWESVKDSKLLSKARKLKDDVFDSVGAIADKVKAKGSDIISGIKTGYENSKESGLLSKVRRIGTEAFSAVGNIGQTVKSKGADIISGLNEGYESKKQSGFLSGVDKIRNQVTSAIGNISQTVKGKGSDIVSGLSEGFTGSINQFTNIISGIPWRIISSIGNLWQVGRDLLQNFINGFTSIHIPTPHFDIGWKNVSVLGANFNLPQFKGINWYYGGGFPENGEMFIANEAGPEMIGKMGRRNTVANNNQIVEGIKSGVFSAVMDAFDAGGLFAKRAADGNIVLEFTLNVDSETMYRLVRKGQLKHERRYTVTANA